MTIDTKSLLLGITATLLFLTLTSGKVASGDDNLEMFSKEKRVYIFNKSTKTLYEYSSNFSGKLLEKPAEMYKVAPDGSSFVTD